MNKKVLALAVALAGSPAAFAETSELSALKAELRALIERVETLESENEALKETSAETREKTEKLSSAAQWTRSIKLKGDLRYRYESIEQEGKDARERNRVRARVLLTAQPTDNIEVGVGVATGSDDPVSTNQTLGNGGSTKDLRLDLAYASWQATPSVKVVAGKMKNVFYKPGKSPLLWDGDWTPEGLSVVYSNKGWFANSSLMWLESDTKNDNHRFGYGIQAGFKGKTDRLKYTAGFGYHMFGTEGRETFYGDADDFFGNSYTCVDASTNTGCAYVNDYQEVELFADVASSVGELPVTAFVHYVTNTDADDFDAGWSVGVKLGKASAAGTWDLGYVYQDLEADAVFGLLTDSDFAGGGTDGVGHVISGGYAINKHWKISFTYFDTEQSGNIGTERDYKRLQVNTQLKF